MRVSRSLSWQVWICIFITVIIVAPILNLVHRYSYFYKFYYSELDNNKGLFKMKNCYWYIYGSLLQQGGFCTLSANLRTLFANCLVLASCLRPLFANFRRNSPPRSSLWADVDRILVVICNRDGDDVLRKFSGVSDLSQG